ncbi:50S ribosomal protein L23 [Patescibacteria group bacterium]|nr:50S ribosomal protein L23 [Patescibacteria group bacterium]
MAFSIFKKKKSEPEKEKKEKKKISPKSSTEEGSVPAKDVKEEKEQIQKTAAVPRKGTIFVAPRVLVRPNITEKATILTEENKYVFKVFPDATKGLVKDSVEEVYGVDVESVRIINIPPKKVRLGKRREGIKKGYKKAVVKVKEGQKIEILPR